MEKKIFAKINSEAVKRIFKKGSVVLLTTALSLSLSGCNREIIDKEYGLDTGLIIGDDTAIMFDIKSWKDYEGEQYQIITPEGLVILTASFDTDLFYGHSDEYSIQKIAKNALSESGEVHYLNKIDDSDAIFNKTIIDTQWKFNKSVTFNKNKAMVLNIAKWRDYDGEQLQVITEDEMVILLSSYNTKLFNDNKSELKAEEFAQKYVGLDGKVYKYGNESSNRKFNYDLFDFNYNFNKIIIIKDNSAVILPIESWKDYEGEQLQVKVVNGPTILTAAYDSILINDIKSDNKALNIAQMLSDNVIDYSKDIPHTSEFFNKTLLDFNYAFNNAIISNDNSATSVSVRKWDDYEGEQLQITLPSGDLILTSSIFLDLINGGSEVINASTLAHDYASEKVIDTAQNITKPGSFNYQLIDFELKFKYALRVENGNVTILPLAKWKDYYNSNGYKSMHRSTNADGSNNISIFSKEDSPNCEQFQLELPDSTVILTSAYDTILVKNVSDIEEIAEMFRGENGVITNLTSTFGEPVDTGWNIKIFDTKWNYNYAIYESGENSQIFEINSWMDFADGEQVQLRFPDKKGLLTSYVNTSLISSDDERKVEILAKAFAGKDIKTEYKSLTKNK